MLQLNTADCFFPFWKGQLNCFGKISCGKKLIFWGMSTGMYCFTSITLLAGQQRIRVRAEEKDWSQTPTTITPWPPPPHTHKCYKSVDLMFLGILWHVQDPLYVLDIFQTTRLCILHWWHLEFHWGDTHCLLGEVQINVENSSGTFSSHKWLILRPTTITPWPPPPHTHTSATKV